jgi:hypothetical protein
MPTSYPAATIDRDLDQHLKSADAGSVEVAESCELTKAALLVILVPPASVAGVAPALDLEQWDI